MWQQQLLFMSLLDQRLKRQLELRHIAGNYRQLTPPSGGVDFFSNDYLGIVRNGIPGAHTSQSSLPTGATGSRLLSGNHSSVIHLEQVVALHHRGEAALVFNSGYEANMGLITAIAGRHTCMIYDELCHASIIDGIRASTCIGRHTYRHNDMAHLGNLLRRQASNIELVVITESVFSMDGDLAPLNTIALLCKQYGAKLIVDEAHATGVFGARGEGVTVLEGLEELVYARVHTFGKAIGGFGAAVVCSSLLKDFLINFSRPFIFTTALPPATTEAVASVYRYLNSDSFSNSHLHHLISHFREQVSKGGDARWAITDSPIQTLITGSNASCREIALRMNLEGLAVKPIMSPTVPAGRERIRVCLHQFNTTTEINHIIALV